MARFSGDRLALYSAALAAQGLSAPRATQVPRRAQPERAPLSRAQERLFFLELYEPGTPLYNDAVSVHVTGELDELRLARALAAVAARHEILRTTLVLTGAGPEQRIHALEELRPTLAARDLAGEPDARAAARRAAQDEARRPFDLEHGPLWRATLLRLAPDERVLVLAMHHIVSDGASMGLFFDELAHAYAQPEGEREPLAVQFGDYATWERTSEEPERTQRDLAYWQGVLAREFAPCAWAESRGTVSHVGVQLPLRLAADDVERLAERARAAQVTSNQWLLAAWLVLLAAESGEPRACTGIASSLRRRRELEPLIGFFVQSVPLCVALEDDATFLALLARVRAAAFEAQEHDGLPFDRIARAGGGKPLALQTFFAHMRDAIRPPDLAGARTTFEFVDPGVARFELALVLHESAAGLSGFLEYDLGVFAPATAERLVADYRRILTATLARPELALAELAAPRTPRSERRPPRTLPPRRAAGA
jgi:hypothetical protein